MFKFGQKEVTTKDFYGQRQITDIFTINANKCYRAIMERTVIIL